MLWSRSFTPAAEQTASSSASPVNSLIRDALIEGRNAENKYEKDGYAVKWTFVNDLELIFVVRPTDHYTRCPNYRQQTGGISANIAIDIRRRTIGSTEGTLRSALSTVPLYLRCFSAREFYRQGIHYRYGYNMGLHQGV